MEVQLHSFITLTLAGVRVQLDVRLLYAASKDPVSIEEKAV
jgi:hypothetical protein